MEFWYARELQQVLEYKRWGKFNNVIDNAKIACSRSENEIDEHFSQVGNLINFIIQDIEDYIMEKQQMIVLEGRN